jgi:hypothetical protein
MGWKATTAIMTQKGVIKGTQKGPFWRYRIAPFGDICNVTYMDVQNSVT